MQSLRANVVDALAHNTGGDWATLLSAQLSSPVRWKHCLLTLASLGVTDYVELGPGGVLTGMAKRTVDAARTLSVSTPEFGSRSLSRRSVMLRHPSRQRSAWKDR
jgi:malonyl CoA-acyl carrier protein transacylase